MSDTNSPINSGPGMPLGGTTLPGGGGPTAGLPGADKVATQQAQLRIQNQLSSQFDLGDIFSGVGDVWGWIRDHASDLVPKEARNADGSIDWAKLGGDAIAGLGHFLSDHKSDILTALNVVNSTQRQNKADALGAEAVDLAKKRYAAQEPLRIAGQAGMLDPSKNTPDLSRLGAMSQGGLSQMAALPLAQPKTNLANAQQIAGPNSGNPFAPKAPSALPLASAPTLPAVPAPQSYAPSKPGALPLAPVAPPVVPNGVPARPVPPDVPGMSPNAPGRPSIEPVVPKRRIFDPNDPANLALPLASGY